MFDLASSLSAVTDSRERPQISTKVVAQSVLAMFLCRLGSLNSIEQLKGSKSLREFLDAPLPSADSLGRILDLVDSDSIRTVIHQMYDRAKRSKMLQSPSHGLVALIIDGHESHATYLRHCEGCLERKKDKGGKETTQYYHRNVTAQLVFAGVCFLLDAESQIPGEGELPCAMRLLERVLCQYPKAFQVVVMDALYAKSTFFNKIIEHNKHAIAVLKDQRRELFKAAEDIFNDQVPQSFELRGTKIDCWDASDLRSWTQVKKPVRVIRTHEIPAPIVRQLSRESEEQPASRWTWVTTLSAEHASSRDVIELAHSRWSIENEGFNELVNHWHADHVYKHAPAAFINFWLMSMLAYNLFRAFFLRNLRPAVRRGKTMLHFARLLTAQLFVTCAVNGVPP
ncbi:MAG: transposase [Nitrososphaerales archaeon]